MASFAEAPEGNPTAGAKIFKTKCSQCHVVEAGAGHKQVGFGFVFLCCHEVNQVVAMRLLPSVQAFCEGMVSTHVIELLDFITPEL